MAEIDFDYDFGFDESKDIFKQREEILENYTKHFSSMNVFDHFNLLKRLAPNDRFRSWRNAAMPAKSTSSILRG